jgi:hypothetical protein
MKFASRGTSFNRKPLPLNDVSIAFGQVVSVVGV